jgi:hypothetical protein
MRRGPAVNAANHFRMRFKGKIPGSPGARQNPDGSTEVIPAPPKAKLRLYGGWPTRKRARIFISTRSASRTASGSRSARHRSRSCLAQ